MSNFRFNAKKIFLTYPQCDMSKASLLDAANAWFPNKVLNSYCIAQERHQDGNLHLHAYFEWDSAPDTRSASKFDIVDRAEKSFHPNVKGVGKSKNDVVKILRYLTKYDKEPLTDIDIDTYIKENTKGKANNENFANAVAIEDAEEARKFIRDHEPRTYIANFNNVNSWANSLIKPKVHVPKIYPTVPNVPDIFLKWKAQIGSDERTNLLIVNGPTKCGKSTYFRSLGPHAFMKGTWNADVFKNPFTYTVIDDVNWVMFKDFVLNNRGVFLGDGDVSLTDKYRHKSTISFTGKPCVILCNDNQAGAILSSFDNESYEDQVWYYEVPKGVKLWKELPPPVIVDEAPCTPGQEMEYLFSPEELEEMLTQN